MFSLLQVVINIFYLNVFADTDEYWESEGLQLKLIEPMKKWSVSYHGEMIHQDTKEAFKVSLQVLPKPNKIFTENATPNYCYIK